MRARSSCESPKVPASKVNNPERIIRANATPSTNPIKAGSAFQLGMVNRVVPRPALLDETLAIARRVAEMPRFGLALAKRAVNAAEDRMGMRDAMDTAFALHHLAHAHNLLTSPDHLGGEDAHSMARKLR